MRTSNSLMASLFIASALAGCGDDGTTTPTVDMATTPTVDMAQAPTPDMTQTAKDIVDTAVAAGSFKTLVAAVGAAGLEQTLRGAGPFTVFAPPDSAFGAIPPALVGKLITPPYKAELGLILKYHVVAGKVPAADVLGKKQDVATVAGPKLNIDGSNNKVVINGKINVTMPDVMASNGVIHVVDGVILPSVVDTAVAYDDGTNKFSTLVAAVGAAGLAATLNTPGPFTVFAPNDAAFDALKKAVGEQAFNAILADKAKLTRILTYHAVGGAVYESDVKPGDVTTVSTDKFTVAVAGGKVTITDGAKATANVILTDLPCSNGVIHVIDKVLLPPGL